MSQYSNQDAFGWIAAVLSFLAFVACGAPEEEYGRLRVVCVSEVDFEAPTTATFDTVSTTNVENASTSESDTCEVLRQATRRALSYRATRRSRLSTCSAREFQTLANRLTFERADSRVFRFRPFWKSLFSPLPLFISFLTLRN